MQPSVVDAKTLSQEVEFGLSLANRNSSRHDDGAFPQKCVNSYWAACQKSSVLCKAEVDSPVFSDVSELAPCPHRLADLPPLSCTVDVVLYAHRFKHSKFKSFSLFPNTFSKGSLNQQLVQHVPTLGFCKAETSTRWNEELMSISAVSRCRVAVCLQARQFLSTSHKC